MIDPIQNQPRPEYTPKKAIKASQAGSGETFSLNYSEEGVLYEPSAKEETEKDTAAKKENSGSFRRSAALELSQQEEKPTASGAPQQSSFAETLRSFFARAVAVLKKAWSFIWENKPADNRPEQAEDILAAENTLPDGLTEESAADKNAAEYADSETLPAVIGEKDASALHAENDPAILKALKSGNSAKFQSLLTEDGRRISARNSSLLTYYDSKGNLTSPDASMQQRILHGDRGSMKR